MRHFVLTMLLAPLTVLSLGCDAHQGGSSSAVPATGQKTVFKVAATPVPAADVLKFVQSKLAAQQGLDIQITEFSDYVQPNIALNEKQVDANRFQHVPYMENFGKQHKIDMVAVAKVYIVPLGIYSRRVKSLNAVPENAVVAIPNDVVNTGRALHLLALNKLLKLKEGVTAKATLKDITDNPKHIQIKELEAAQLP